MMINFLENEEIILEKRRHWFVILTEGISLFLAMILLPVAIAVMNSFVEVAGYFITNHLLFIVFMVAVWWQFLWMMFFVAWTNYYLDVLIITNKRVIDIEQLGLFARDMVEVRLERIQDIKIEVKGIVASLLKFGDIYIQTAGESREVIIRHIADPQEIREAISKYCDELINKTNNHG